MQFDACPGVFNEMSSKVPFTVGVVGHFGLAVRSPKRGVVPPSALPSPFVESSGRGDACRLDDARRTFEERFVRAALVRTGGHRGRAAAELGVTRQGLTKLLTRLGISP